MSHKKKSDFDKLRLVEEILDQDALLSKEILDFLFWSANYYHHPLGQVLASALPKNLREGKPADIKKTSVHKNTLSPVTFDATTEQSKAIKSVLKSENNFHGFLLHGVTGSGKTEVYLSITKALLKKGRQVLVLVPEIGLTPPPLTGSQPGIPGVDHIDGFCTVLPK